MHFDTTCVMFNPAKIEVYRQNYGENGLHQSGTGALLEVVNWKAISFRQMNTRDLRRPTVTYGDQLGNGWPLPDEVPRIRGSGTRVGRIRGFMCHRGMLNMNEPCNQHQPAKSLVCNFSGLVSVFYNSQKTLGSDDRKLFVNLCVSVRIQVLKQLPVLASELHD